MKDLTKGKPSTLILAFALPIFFANLLQLTYSLVDTRIVGTFLGEDFCRDFLVGSPLLSHRNSVQRIIKVLRNHSQCR